MGNNDLFDRTEEINRLYEILENEASEQHEVIVDANLQEIDKLNSLTYLVIRFTKAYKNPSIVASKLKITLEDVLDIYLNNSEYLNQETLLLYVIHNKPLYIFKVINLPYYRELFEELTPTEQERLYILMVQKNNKETPVRKAKR